MDAKKYRESKAMRLLKSHVRDPKHKVCGQDYSAWMYERAQELARQIHEGTFQPVVNTPEEQAKVDAYLRDIRDAFTVK